MKKLPVIILFLLLIFTGCGSEEPVVVKADFLTEENIPDTTGMGILEIIPLSEEYDLFLRSKDTEGSRYIVFSADTAVKDFTLYTIAVSTGDKYDCEKPVLQYDDLSAEKSLIIRLNKRKGHPWYGISYKDENGDTVKYAVHTGGEEVYLEKFE